MPSRSKSTSKALCRELLVKHYVTSHGRFDYRADRVAKRFCDVSRICSRLRSPFRPSATHFEGPK
ncbi:hypothetical protein CFN58_16090 [Pseudomonas avellanae]|uniref:Uncharacterized protein n=2 Tax=Pseudomonas syringae group TaxID=136849 RepID=A0A261WI28_9PSED|nr:hypothetical protein CT122_06555 [Pseudomonas syringae pv. actinidiae]OZI85821.1 hypothetical protein CFN58_16090 [Pseudomonas avellanae]PIN62299.1 hypothetical protein CUB86_06890 [Pseudomonas syringae pv. actinidiae]